MTSFKLSTTSYHVLLLHAQKYLHAVTGLLLGKKSGETVEIIQALPLAHSDLTIHTTPVTESSLHFAEHYAASQNVSIVGLYFSNDVIDDTTLPTHVVRIAGKVRQRFADACILRIDGTKLKPSVRQKEHCLILHCGEGWKRCAAEGLVEKAGPTNVEKALRVDGVSDFEDHLLDPTADWLNGNVTTALDAL